MTTDAAAELEVRKRWFEASHREATALGAAVPKGGVDVTDEDGRTALHWAAAEGHAETARALLAAGANARHKDDGGWTPLMSCASAGHALVARLLLVPAVAVAVDDTNARGCTALHYACSKAHMDVVTLLLAAGADPRRRDKTGATALHRAAAAAGGGSAEIVAALIGSPHGRALVTSANDEGETPLHTAILMKNTATAEVLVRAGAPLDHKDADGKTPLDRASAEARESLQAALEARGVPVAKKKGR
jgi:26S proteasome non-ATPase regulatory subunit 10